MKLSEKTILVTGATSGIGERIVELLFKKNKVIALGRNTDKLQKLQDKFRGIEIIKADLAVIRETEKAAGEILDKFSRLDVLINNAAVQNTPEFNSRDFRHETIISETNINFTSPCILVARLLPIMKNRGVILNVNSGLAIAPKTGSAVYCATKAALDSFSVSLGYQLENTGIRVLQAFLPLVETGMTAGRGSGKLSAQEAARLMIRGIEREKGKKGETI